MKIIFQSFFFLSLFCVVSCVKEDTIPVSQAIPLEDPMESFAYILSKAVSNDQPLRAFLKNNALRQFDKDYDIFYPFVKDDVVRDNITFRECLLRYTSETELSRIETELPLLDILIPDYSWLGAFSVNKWDIQENDVSVAFKKGEDLSVYSDGVLEGVLEKNEYADFPILIIKNNERMKIKTDGTKGSIAQYDFVDYAFDVSKDIATKVVSIYYYDQLYNISQPDDLVSPSELNPYVINAYNEFHGDDYKYQRDNIYFGLTNAVSSGQLNTYIREYLYKFRFVNPNDGALYDATTESDPNYPDGYFPSSFKASGDSLSISTLRNKDFRIDGNLEMRFRIIYGSSSGTASSNTICLSVPFKDLFSYNKVLVEYKHETWFTTKKYTYTINPNCLVPKWYTANIELPIASGAIWNIGNTSTNIVIRVEEWDSGETTTTSHSITYSTATNVTTSASGTSVKSDYCVQSSESITSTVTYSRTNTTDELGDIVFNYVDPVLLNYSGGKYLVKTYNTGDVVMMIIPKHI